MLGHALLWQLAERTAPKSRRRAVEPEPRPLHNDNIIDLRVYRGLRLSQQRESVAALAQRAGLRRPISHS